MKCLIQLIRVKNRFAIKSIRDVSPELSVKYLWQLNADIYEYFPLIPLFPH